jgi:hypothetical protein
MIAALMSREEGGSIGLAPASGNAALVLHDLAERRGTLGRMKILLGGRAD